MYRTTLILALCLCATTARARDGVSLSASYGAGLGFQRNVTTYSGSFSGNPWYFSPVLAQKADLSLSYQSRHWIVQAGIGYWRGGYIRDQRSTGTYIAGYTPLPNGYIGIVYATPLIHEKMIYTQLAIPLMLGYRSQLTRRWSLTPSVGYTFSYNLGLNRKTDDGRAKTNYPLPADAFSTGYKRSSSWAAVHADVGYQVAPRFNVFFGPRFAYMFTRLTRDNDKNYERSPLKLYNITFNAGISWQLAREKAVVKE